jgi:hypothetical protein
VISGLSGLARFSLNSPLVTSCIVPGLLALALAGCAPAGDDLVAFPDGKADDLGVQLPRTYAIEMKSEKDQVHNTEKTHTALLARLVGVATFEQASDGTLTLSVRPCRYIMPTTNPDYVPYLDERFLDQKVAAVRVPIQVGTGDEPSFRAQPTAFVLGVELDRPLTDPLPTTQTAAVVDQDGDDKPGITANVDDIPLFGTEGMFGALRARFTLAAALDPTSGGFVGTSELDQEFEIYGDSLPGVDAAQRRRETAASSTTTPVSSAVRMLPVAKDTCAAALAVFP